MFDFHMHSSVSCDSTDSARDMALAAKAAGLSEICFTDHYDQHFYPDGYHNVFSLDEYKKAYDALSVPGITVRRGMEFNMARWNKIHLQELLQQYPFDFVIGSVHFADGHDPYEPEFWQGRSPGEAFRVYLEEVLRCVQIHEGFDVLGHLTYVCKSVYNPTHEPVLFRDYREITDEIMKVLVAKGKGMEINTSGVDRAGAFLPSEEYFARFRELGGEIVTVGSDAHDCSRVGQYIPQALEILKKHFGYVCTFEGRKPVFHSLSA